MCGGDRQPCLMSQSTQAAFNLFPQVVVRSHMSIWAATLPLSTYTGIFDNSLGFITMVDRWEGGGGVAGSQSLVNVCTLSKAGY